MNKFTKITLITGGSLIGLGLLFGGIGYALNGFRFAMPNDVEYTKKVFELPSDISDIDIKEYSEDIRVKVVNDGSPRLEYWDSDNITHSVNADSEKLTVRTEDHSEWYENIRIGFNMNFQDTTTVLYITSDMIDDLVLTTSSGDISIEGPFDLNELDLTASSGDITINGHIEAGSVAVSASSGDVTTRDITCEDSFSVTTQSGDITVEILAASDTLIEASSGDVTFNDFDGGNTNIRTHSGDITGTVIGSYDFNASASSGDVIVPNSGEGPSFNVTASSGDIVIR